MIDQEKVANIRRHYLKYGLSEKDVDPNPVVLFEKWFQDACDSKLVDPNAMTLSTISLTGKPSSRIVLVKKFSEEGFVFYANYESRKGLELAANSSASLVFFWNELERQVRIAGDVDKISREESKAYFHTRPFESQIGAWASEQSSVIENREVLDKRFDMLKKQYEGKEVPLPPSWGGYLLVPHHIEFWQGRANRLHDRLLYTKEDEKWTITRLAP